jgi:hypothetical protein
MQDYDGLRHGKLKVYEYPEAEVARAIERLRELYSWYNTSVDLRIHSGCLPSVTDLT